MTLKSQIAADVDAVFRVEDDFAEQLTYLPKAGGSRSVVGIVDEQGTFEDQQTGQGLVNVITLLVSRDAASAKGFIDQPQIGDGVKLADGRAFDFSGVIEDVDAAAWTLEFRRSVPTRSGLDQKLAR